MTDFYELRVYTGGEWRVVGPEHDIITELHTAAGTAQWNVVGTSGANTLGWLLARNDPGVAASVLRTDTSGHLSLIRLNTDTISDKSGGDLIISPTGDIKLNPTGAQIRVMASHRIQSDNYASQSTGWGIGYDGSADFRYLFTDELHAKSFIADLEQALAGGQIITKSVAVLASNFIAPFAGPIVGVNTTTDLFSVDGNHTSNISIADVLVVTGSTGNNGTWSVESVSYDAINDETDIYVTGNVLNATVDGYIGFQRTLVVEDLPSASNMAVFESGDFIGLRTFDRSGGSLTIGWCWGTVSGYTDGSGVQSWTFLRHGQTPGAVASGTTIYAKSIVLDFGVSGNGYYEVNAIDGLRGVNSPYAQAVTWATHPATKTVRSRFGNLYGITAVSGEFGLLAGNGFASDAKYIKASSEGVLVYNSDIRIYKNPNNVIVLDNTAPYLAVGNPAPTAFNTNDGFWVGNDGGTYKFRIGDLDGALLSWDGTALKLGVITGNHISSSGSAIIFYNNTTEMASLSSTSWTLGNTSSNHVLINATSLQIKAGSVVYADLTGTTFRVGASGSERLQWDGSDLSIYDNNNTAVFNVGASGTWLSSLVISESMGQILFSGSNGLALWGPSCPLSTTEWVSTRGQSAAFSGGFRVTQGRWAGSRAIQMAKYSLNKVLNPNLGGTYTAGVAPNWAKGGTTTALTCTESTAFPAFGTKCQKLVFTTGASTPYFYCTPNSMANSTEYTWQMWIYVESLTTSVGMRLYTGSVYQTVSVNTTGWHHLVYTGTTESSGSQFIFFVVAPSNNAATVYLCGAQVEAGSVATPLISGDMGFGHTWGGAAYDSTSSRSINRLIAPIGGVVNVASGSIVINFKLNNVNSSMFLFTAGDANAEFDAYVSVSGALYFRINGATRCTATPIVAEQEHQAVFTWDVAGNVSKLYLDGELADTDTCGGTTWTAYTSLYIGDSHVTSTGQLNGWISQFATFGVILTDDQVAAMYSSQSPLVDTKSSSSPGIFIYDGRFHIASSSSGARIEMDSTGLVGYDSDGTQRFDLGADGSGWLGASDVFAWDSSGVVAFKASSLIEPWNTPSIIDALLVANKYGGGMRRWAWEATNGRLHTSYGMNSLAGSNWVPTAWKVTQWGGPYVDFNGSDQSLRAAADETWQEILGYTYLVWAWCYADTLSTNHRVIVGKWDTGAGLNRRRWLLYWDNTSGKFTWSVSKDGTNVFYAGSSLSETTGVWYFVAGFYQPSTVVRVYAGAATSSSLTVDSNTTSIPTDIPDTITNILWGGANESDGSNGTWLWDGGIGVCAGYQGIPSTNINDYVDLVFQQTKQFYGG